MYTCSVTTSELSTDSRSDDSGVLTVLLTSDGQNDLQDVGLPLRIAKISVGFGPVGGYQSPVYMRVVTSPYRVSDDFSI